MKQLILIFTLGWLIMQCQPKKTNSGSKTFPGKPVVPAIIIEVHDSLLNQLKEFSTSGDSTARAAAKLHELLEHHFMEEEDYALSALGLLPALAEGKIPEESKAIIQLIEKFRSNKTHMSFEHQMINAWLDELRSIAGKEQHPGIENFSKLLIHHSKLEDDLLFPTVILIGEYLKLKDQ